MMQILKISIERLCMYLQRIKKREYGFAVCARPHHADKDLIFVPLFYDQFNVFDILFIYCMTWGTMLGLYLHVTI